MDFEEVLQSRHSCRKFRLDPIEEEKKTLLLKAAQMGPSGRNLRPYRFVLVESKEMMDRVYDGLPFGRYPCPNALLIVGDERRSEALWVQDCAAAAENVLLMATNLGLGSVWCAVYPYNDRLRNIDSIASCAEGEHVFCAILLGYPSDEDKAREKVFREELITRI